MPDVKRLSTLIRRLNELSDAGEIPWAETADERVFQAALKTYIVTIAQEWAGQNWGTDIYRYVIRLLDPVGRVLDSATAEDFQGNSPMEMDKSEAGETLQHLYDAARRKALKTDEALDDLLNFL